MRSFRAYILTLAAVSALLLISAAAAIVHQIESLGRRQTEAQLLDTTRALSGVVDGRLNDFNYLLQTLAVSDAVERRDFSAVDQQARLALQEPDAWIIVADREGRQWVNTRLPPGAPLPSGPLPATAWRELDTGKPRVCSLSRGLVEKQILCVDHPIMQDGRAAYIISVIFRPHLLQRVIDAQAIPKGRYASIVDRDDTIVWRNIDAETFVGRKATGEMLQALQTQDEGVLQSRTLDGVVSVSAFSKSRQSGWAFITAVPKDQFAAGSRKALLNGGWIAVALLLGSVAAAWLAIRGVMRDIKKLQFAAGRIRARQPPVFAASRFREFEALSSLLAEAIAERDATRERFDLAQEVGGVGAWEWDSLRDEGIVTESYKEMHGLSHVEGPLKFAQVLAVVHPDDRDGYLERLEAARGRRDASTNEYRVLLPDGSIRWISAKGRPIFDPQGRAVGALGIVRDATAEHEAQAALQQLNALLERKVEERDRLWEIARDPFVVADRNGVWLAASPAWSAILGYPLEDFLGRTSEWLEHPDDIERTRAEDRKLAEGDVTERFENRFRARDGSYRWFSWTAVPEGGRFYSVARDVTEEKSQAEALKKAEEGLRQAQKMESIGQITGGVAHDFNNLLMPIVGALDLLQQRGLPDPRSERMVAGALEAAERARLLVQRLLAFARRQPLRVAPIDLRSTLASLEPLLVTTLGAQVKLVIDADRDFPPVVADANQLELALLNLAVNARDAMPDGGTFTVSVQPRTFAEGEAHGLQAGRYVELQVTDTGVGMPPSVLERAIEPFFSTKGLGRGTGLGLSMVHGLAAQLGGAMHIDSVLGKGASIRLWLPASEVRAEVLPSGASQLAEPLAHGTAVLVDDEPGVRESGAELLRALGYQVLEADSAEAALSLLRAHEGVGLLVTDHLMPGMSGVELARRVRTGWPQMKILIVSGYADVDDIAPDFARLTKPFRRAELAEALVDASRRADPAAISPA